MILHCFLHTLFQRNSRNPAGTCKEKKTRTENFTEEKEKRKRERKTEKPGNKTAAGMCSLAVSLQHTAYKHTACTAV